MKLGYVGIIFLAIFSSASAGSSCDFGGACIATPAVPSNGLTCVCFKVGWTRHNVLAYPPRVSTLYTDDEYGNPMYIERNTGCTSITGTYSQAWSHQESETWSITTSISSSTARSAGIRAGLGSIIPFTAEADVSIENNLTLAAAHSYSETATWSTSGTGTVEVAIPGKHELRVVPFTRVARRVVVIGEWDTISNYNITDCVTPFIRTTVKCGLIEASGVADVVVGTAGREIQWSQFGTCGGGGGGDEDNDGTPDEDDDDIDGDGVSNDHDDDVDGDGIPNDLDNDDDGDGIDDGDDPMPNGAVDGSNDVDGDGVDNGDDNDVDGDDVDNEDDSDIDGDGIDNEDDADMDGDGLTNDEDDDIDGDGIPNEDDDTPNGPGSDQPTPGSILKWILDIIRNLFV